LDEKTTQGIASLFPKPTLVDRPQLRVSLILSSDRFSSRDIPHRSQIDGAFGSQQARISNPSCDRMAALQYIFPSATGPIGKQGLNGFFNLHLFTSADYACTTVGHEKQDIQSSWISNEWNTLSSLGMPCPEALKNVQDLGRSGAELGELQLGLNESELD
jgi:hypothetical protein